MKQLVCLFVSVVVLALGSSAQNWMPMRDTNHIRILRSYLIDSTTGERSLLKHEEYDRQGYLTGENISLTYNERGQLIRRVEVQKTDPDRTGTVRMDTVEMYDIHYSPDGKVDFCTWVQSQGEYAMVNTYRLIPLKEKPGCKDLAYLHSWHFTRQDTVFYWDTVIWRHCYDGQGRLVSDEQGDYGGRDIDYSNSYYTYDSLGRVSTCVSRSYEYEDSLTYHYDRDGHLTGMTGKGYDVTLECDIVIHCRPDGTYSESWMHWRDVTDTDVAEEVVYSRYDERGVMIYYKDNRLNYEFEIEYWE